MGAAPGFSSDPVSACRQVIARNHALCISVGALKSDLRHLSPLGIKMHIVYVVYLSFPAASITGIVEQCQNLARFGITVTVIALPPPKLAVSFGPSQVDVRYVLPNAPSGTFNTLQSMWPFVRNTLYDIERLHPDVVHVNTFPGAFVLPLLGRSRLRTTWVHDIRSGGVNPGLRGLAGDLYLQQQTRWFDANFYLSEFMAQRLHGRLRPNDFVVPIGVNTTLFQPYSRQEARRHLGLAEEDLVFIYSGTISPARQLHLLLASFRMTLARVARARLVLLGAGRDLPRLKALAQEWNIAHRVTFVGEVPYTQVAPLLCAADIALSYVPITPAYDGQPVLKAMEYLACGLPVLATDTRGHRLCITPGVNGILANDDSESWAAAMLNLAHDVPLQMHLAASARASSLIWDFGSIAANTLIPAYQTVMARSQRH